MSFRTVFHLSPGLQVSVMDGAEIIQRILELLSSEDDGTCKEWVACIVTELVEHAPRLLPLPQPCAVLLSGMQLPHMARSIPKYLEVGSCLCNTIGRMKSAIIATT